MATNVNFQRRQFVILAVIVILCAAFIMGFKWFFRKASDLFSMLPSWIGTVLLWVFIVALLIMLIRWILKKTSVSIPKWTVAALWILLIAIAVTIISYCLWQSITNGETPYASTDNGVMQSNANTSAAPKGITNVLSIGKNDCKKGVEYHLLCQGGRDYKYYLEKIVIMTRHYCGTQDTLRYRQYPDNKMDILSGKETPAAGWCDITFEDDVSITITSNPTDM